MPQIELLRYYACAHAQALRRLRNAALLLHQLAEKDDLAAYVRITLVDRLKTGDRADQRGPATA
jgi:hypothetical protein